MALSDDISKVLMGRMRYPSLSIHGVEGAFSAPGAKTVIVSIDLYVVSKMLMTLLVARKRARCVLVILLFAWS